VNGTAPVVDGAAFQEAIAAYQAKQQAAQAAERDKVMAEREVKGAENAQKGAEYLAAKAQEDGIQKTESGILYEVLTAAEGDKPTAESTVKVHYRGTLIDGTQVDSRYDRGQPAQFPLNGVSPGWTEGLQLMSVGSKFRLHIPAELAYGLNAPPSIGPNQVLVFDVELLEIVQ